MKYQTLFVGGGLKGLVGGRGGVGGGGGGVCVVETRKASLICHLLILSLV